MFLATSGGGIVAIESVENNSRVFRDIMSKPSGNRSNDE